MLIPRDFYKITYKVIGRRFGVIVFLLLLFPIAGHARDHAREDFIGVLLYRIATNIHWANSVAIQSYNIHVIDDDSAIADQLENIAEIRQLHGKKFRVTNSGNLAIPANVQLVYLSSAKLEYFQQVRQKILNKNVLLVTHNVKNDELIFLNLYDDSVEGKIKFHINKANVINQNLGVDPDIILLGGSEVDVAALYRQGQEKLDNAKQQLTKIENDIKKISSDRAELSVKLKQRQSELEEQSAKLVGARTQVKQLTEQTQQYQSQLSEFSKKLADSQLMLQRQEERLARQGSTIEKQKISIENQKQLQKTIEQELQVQQQRVQKQQIALDERKQRLDQQKNEIAARSKILKDQESKIALQNQEIDSQKNKIELQAEELKQQFEEMSHRGKVIADQRTYLFLLSSLVGMALLVIVLIYRNSRHNKIVNEQLTEQRDLLSRSAIELAKARDIADKANHAKSAFLANMSHELRTPLNAVLGFSEFLGNDADLSDKQIRYINIVNRSGQHLLSMINDVLDISKIEAGMVSIELESIDIRELCSDVVSILSAKAEAESLRLHLVVDSDVPDFVLVDAVKLRQILINLIGNSIKFSNSGDIELSVGATNNREKIQFRVKDQGIGISKENQALIFKPFAQVGESSMNRKGSGLGLAISRQYALLMGGDLNVESSPGNGSIFICALPLRVGSGSGAKILPFNRRITSLEDHCVKRSLLIVDDHDESRMLLNNILSEVGFHVEEAVNGEMAVKKYKKKKYDMIFMDINMPVMDGVEATRRIRAEDEGDQIKIVAVTANARKEQLQEIQSESFDDIVFKPYRINQIFEIVAEHLNAKFKYEHEKRPPVAAMELLDLNAISSLSDESIDRLLGSARQLEIEQFSKVLDEVTENENCRGLLHLAQEFRFDSIIKILEEAKNLRERNGIA